MSSSESGLSRAAKSAGAHVGFDHQALRPAEDAVPLERARLSDQQRLAAVLQGAALLAHLEHAGRFLPEGWRPARWAPEGRLCFDAPAPGRAAAFPQVQLVELVRVLFGAEEVAGRGRARRAARRLLERWRQTLVRQHADRAVAAIFEVAPFLWQDGFGVARRALGAAHGRGRGRHLWVAGPGRNRVRLLAAVNGAGRTRDLAELETLLASDRAHALWAGWDEAGEIGEDPEALAARGRWRRAVRIWEQRPPRGARAILACARALYALGRYERALDVLRAARGWQARLLRARTQQALGELHAAEITINRLARSALPDRGVVAVAEVAVRLLANSGRQEAIGDWVARARATARGPWRLRAEILAALAAWDTGRPERMAKHLDAAAAARDDPELAVRWHHARQLYCQYRRDGAGVVEHASAALRQGRRRMPRARAGRLWSELTVGRALIDDLPGAERAARHALRLLGACDGPRTTTLAQFNLAEVRMRRGRFDGLAPTLERSTAENRRARNVRGLFHDLVLWARLELAQGRTAAALACCDEARALASAEALDDGVVRVLAARALGWQGRPAKAAAALGNGKGDSNGGGNGDGVPEALLELELEEQPALLFLAGRPDAAQDHAYGTRWGPLWQALAVDRDPRPALWDELGSLEPYRAARLVLDCELARPGTVPPHRVRSAAATLRGCGADALAERLENLSLGPWRALARYLERRRQALDHAVAELLESAGYRDARLSWRGDAGQAPRDLLRGRGGARTLERVFGAGRLKVAAPDLDAILQTLFELIGQDLAAAADVAGTSAPALRSAIASSQGIVGESRPLLAALERAGKLATADLPLLILGESGTGKELTARFVHRASARGDGPFLAVNCAAMAGENLLLSDLFGHVRGAFTGADRGRPGVFETARGGTVFLDEIGDLPLAAQGLLLRVLQESEIRRVGESHSRQVDVRVLAATHRDLERMVDERTFRQDLFFRLKVATVQLPPLRDRGGDIALLADHLVHRASGGRCRLDTAAHRRLQAHPWPGNVRELRNVLEVACALADEGSISPDHLELPPTTDRSSEGTYHTQVKNYRRRLIAEALRATGGKQAEAARRLGLTRQALSYLVRELDLL